MKLTSLALFSMFTFFVVAQQQPTITSGAELQDAIATTKALKTQSLVNQLFFKNIGPSVMSGRVVDLAVNPDNPTEFYVAYATAGVWHTINNGTTFKSIMDNAATQNIADIAVHWPTRTIWVGTGENNASRSSYAGIGLLKSNDNGENWDFVGLPDSQHIGRIKINPNNPEEVVVGVTGHLYSPNTERGIYKTTDGGTSWSKTLYIDDMTGIIDLQTVPENFNIMYATSWTKDRKAWNFDGSGSNSAIYKSTDAGNTWKKLTTEASGFPVGEGVGRIGLAVYNERVLYAIHDSQFRKQKTDQADSSTNGLTKESFKSISDQEFLNLDNKKLNEYLKTNGFHEKYRAENVKQLIRSGSVNPIDLAKYLEDANALLFDTPVIGAEVYKSTDGGVTWAKTHDNFLDTVYYSYGYYFGHIYVSPNDENAIYIYGVPILKSKDGGKTFTSIDAPNVHVDHHALWINPNNPDHLINGNDGGVNITYDDGENWIKNNSTLVGQFYAIETDNQKPYNVYGGLQDNGVWMAPHNASESIGWQQSGHYSWKSILGGDGMQIEVDNRDANIVYTGFQFGNYYRINQTKNSRTPIQPKHELGESPYRFNWQTPIALSEHNQDILYLGGNKLMRSLNQGDDWQAISPDLTKGGKKGNVAYGTITAISESAFQFGLIYVGTDDGLVHLTKNGGYTWTNISAGLPDDLWVSRVIASQHKKERVYATLNGYRWDDFTAYVYMSDDYGNTWKSIKSNLPNFPINVIVEDPKHEDILYLGTDNAAYVSFNRGAKWEAFSKNLTAVAVHDMVVQIPENHLLLGTHGRSIYKASITPLQQFISKNASDEVLTILEVPSVQFSSRWGAMFSPWQEAYEPSITISFYSKTAKPVNLAIKSESGNVLQQLKYDAVKGFNFVTYNAEITASAATKLKAELKASDNGKYYLPKGNYTVKIEDQTDTLEVK